jgi:hypothetical protein
VFLLDCLFDSDVFITSVFADSGDEDDSSPTENLPKRDKGKGRAVYTENLEDAENLPKRDKGKGRAVYTENLEDAEEFDEELSGNIYSKQPSFKEEQEKFDFELAKRLQDEEYRNSLPYNQSNAVSSESDYTVLSSEIHSDDPDELKSKKLKVKEYEDSNRLNSNLKQSEDNDGLKRDYVEESGNENSPNKRIKKT